MKRILLFSFIIFMLSSCDGLFDTDLSQNIDAEAGLKTTTDVKNALTGAYYRLGHYGFYGCYTVGFGDFASDISFANASSGHFVNINQYSFTESSSEILYAWAYGYKVIDATTRVINGAKDLIAAGTVPDDEILELQMYLGEAYGLRALAAHTLVDIFALPYQIGGDNTQLGIVVVDEEPIAAFDHVTRGTVAATYTQILSDIEDAKLAFTEAGDVREAYYMTPAGVAALESRVKLYTGDYTGSINASKSAVGTKTPIADSATYINMWGSIAVSAEDIFTIHKTNDDNLSANSINTLYDTYGATVTAILKGKFAAKDIRRALINGSHPKKFDGIPSNSDVSNIPVFRVSEMYLNMAEAYAEQDDVVNSRIALLNVAKRDRAIVTVDDLPATAADLLTFISDERCRELFQEGRRLYDARRRGEVIDVNNGVFTDFDIKGFVYPIPSDEVNSGFGVVQNAGWDENLPD